MTSVGLTAWSNQDRRSITNEVPTFHLTAGFPVLAFPKGFASEQSSTAGIGTETMNVASSAVLATEPVNSEGVVAAGAYVDGRRVANIAIDEASSWRSRPGHVVWIGLHEPDMALLERFPIRLTIS